MVSRILSSTRKRARIVLHAALRSHLLDVVDWPAKIYRFDHLHSSIADAPCAQTCQCALKRNHNATSPNLSFLAPDHKVGTMLYCQQPVFHNHGSRVRHVTLGSAQWPKLHAHHKCPSIGCHNPSSFQGYLGLRSSNGASYVPTLVPDASSRISSGSLGRELCLQHKLGSNISTHTGKAASSIQLLPGLVFSRESHAAAQTSLSDFRIQAAASVLTWTACILMCWQVGGIILDVHNVNVTCQHVDQNTLSSTHCDEARAEIQG